MDILKEKEKLNEIREYLHHLEFELESNAFIIEEKIIKKGKHWWNFDEKENVYVPVKILGETMQSAMTESGQRTMKKYLVQKENGERLDVWQNQLFIKSAGKQ